MMTDKEFAALTREETDLFAEKVLLESKRKNLKKLAEQHRDDLPALEKDAADQDEIEAEIAEIDKKIAEIKTARTAYKPTVAPQKQNEGVRNIMNAHKNYEQFAEGMQARDAIATPEYRVAYLKRWQGRKDVTESEQRALTTVNNAAVIPTQTLDIIMGRLVSEDTLSSIVTVYNIAGQTSFPIEDVVSDANWVAEGADGSFGTDTTRAVNLIAYKLMRFIRVTKEAKAMSINAFEAWIVDRMVKKMKIAMEKAIAVGTGSGEPTGFIPGTVWIENVNQITATTLTYDNFVDAETLISEEYSVDMVYVMNRTNLAKVRKLKDDTKQPLFIREVEDGFQGTIGGVRVKLSRYVTDGIYLASWSSAYLWNFISAIEFATSMEAAFMSGDEVARAMALVDGKPTGIKGALSRILTSGL